MADIFDIKLSELKEEVKGLKKLVDTFCLSKEEKEKLYKSIKERRIVCLLPLNRREEEQLNNSISEAYLKRDAAYQASLGLPATNDCDEYSRGEIRSVWDILTDSS